MRAESPEGDGAIGLDAREWEEEQLRLDRDWYMGAEEGGLAGDDEHNPLSSYNDLEQLKQAEIAKKQVKKISAKQAQYVSNMKSNVLWVAESVCRMPIMTSGKLIEW